MNAIRGNSNLINAGLRLLMLAAIMFASAACVHWPDVASDCQSYGVLETHQPMGHSVEIEPLYHDELDARCRDAKDAIAMVNPGAEIKGCVIPKDSGVVAAYYSVGDQCAKFHEICHAMHGSGHTERYERDLEQGIPMPYCPRVQLKL